MTTNDDGPGQGAQFLRRAEVNEAARSLFDQDVQEMGFVMNVSRLWAYQPQALSGLFGLLQNVTSGRPFTLRERGILVAACAAALGDSCCSLAWGTKLAEVAGPRLAAGVLSGEDSELSAPERAMAAWAREIARDPNGTTSRDVQALRDAGFCDADIFAMTVFVALRLAFSTVNDALGVSPDAEYATLAPSAVLDAVTFGRPVDAGRPPGS